MSVVTGSRWALSLFALLAAGCSCSGNNSPCDAADPPAACGQACSSLAVCPGGFYCAADETCTADCAMSADCGSGQLCTGDGHCVVDDTDGGGSGGDGGDRADGATGIDANNVCGDIDLTTMQVVPSVVLIVDQSLSMESNDLTPGVTRWDALEDALVGPNGVAGGSGTGPGATGLVFDLQEQVRFGLALYSGDNSTCPILTTVPDPLSGVTTGSYAAIKVAYDAASPIQWTPTHLAMQQVLDDVLAAPPPDPLIFILATDGQPNNCSRDSNTEAEVITQTQRAFSAGIRTYVISLAGSDTALQAHLDQVANAGVGAAPTATPPATSYAPSDTAGLRDSLRTIIGGTLSCTVELNGRVVPDLACMGRVELDGSGLECDGPNGWRLLDETHIEILGTACDTLLGTPGSTLTASFPCEAATLI